MSTFPSSSSVVSSSCHPRRPRTRSFQLSKPVTVGLPSLTKRLPGIQSSATSTPHVIVMVGLPARGKTYIGKKLARYLNWIGTNTKVFNLGSYRRSRTKSEASRLKPDRDHQFFNPQNPEGLRIRQAVCEEALTDMFDWLEEEGEVAVFDATNTTRDRRDLLYRRIVLEKGFKLFFIESICDDLDIVEANIREVKVTSPDYVDTENKDEVVSDFKKRISHYIEQYQPLDEEKEPQYSFMKIFNAGKKVLVYQNEGHIQSRVVYFLMNIHIVPRTLYFCRHGESEYNTERRLGGDSELTESGRQYSHRLGEYINSLQEPNLVVWTSWLQRTVQTARHIQGQQERWKTLNEIDTGDFSGLTYNEVLEKYPQEVSCREENKYSYRFPNGESYEDLVGRLEPVIMELERKNTVVVVAHQAVLRCLLAYFLEIDEVTMPSIEVPIHTVIKLSPMAYGCKREDVFLGPVSPNDNQIL